jgi:phosphoglycerate dehydrogenase-like enzyme
MKIALPEWVRAELEPRLPAGIEPAWFSDLASGCSAVAGAEVGWLDLFPPVGIDKLIDAGTRLRWVSSAFAGVGFLPFATLSARNITVTSGVGINSIPVAEFTVMGMLAAAKNLREIIYAQDRQQWLSQAPGVVELYETNALIIGFGHIGRAIADRLRAFGVKVVGVRGRTSNEPEMLGVGDWRDRLHDFDWIVLAAPLTSETHHMISAGELQRMKSSAWVVNI